MQRGRPLTRATKSQSGFEFVRDVEGQAPVRQKQPVVEPPMFLDPDPQDIWVRNLRLKDYLEFCDQNLPLTVRAVIRAQDLTQIVGQYKGGGRQPIHPAIIVGLVLYGMMIGVDSLRGLEELAKRDVGAWWVCGGVQPDHTTIAKVLNRSAAYLSDEFFTKVTASLLRALGTKRGTVAIDGTVQEAAASRFSLIRREAAKAEAAEAQEAAKAAPTDSGLARAAAHAQAVETVAEQRAARAESMGREGDQVRVSTTDPDAVVQPLKNVGASRPSYKPSVMANEDKLIVGQHVDPSSESAAIDAMLAQYAQMLGGHPLLGLADSGYFDGPTLTTMAEKGIDILVAPDEAWKKASANVDEAGKNVAGHEDRRSRRQKKKPAPKFPKSAFRFDEQEDAFICPVGKRLPNIGIGREAHGLPYTRYQGRDCANCPLRQKCTGSARGRLIKRYDGDDLKEHMVRIFENPLAIERFAQRRVIVEPVFGDLREKQKFRRFRRRGARRVAMEFSLHCVAFNIRRAVSLLQGRRRGVFLCLLARRPGEPWRPIWFGFGCL